MFIFKNAKIIIKQKGKLKKKKEKHKLCFLNIFTYFDF